MTIAGRAEIFDDATALAAGAAAFIADAIRDCAAPYRLCLSGGSTPRAAYKLLAAKNDLPWGCTELFLGDERFVPPDHPDSNCRMVRETLFAGGHVHPRGFFPMQTDGTPDEAAAL